MLKILKVDNKIVSLFYILSIISTPLVTFAQSGPIMGDIELEDEGESVNTYDATQDSIIKLFKELPDAFDTLANGGNAEIPNLDQNQIQYLNGVYLHCSVARGICPFVLDALLELDLINSRVKNKAQCPNLIKFWKSWVQNDMEQRHNYQLKTGFIADTNRFRKNVRPIYIKCKKTIEKELDSVKGSNTDYFAKRYGNMGTTRNAVSLTNQYLARIKKNVGNIYYATGMMQKNVDKK